MNADIVTVSPPSSAMPLYGIMSETAAPAGESKRAGGRFYTKENPFDNAVFRQWAKRAGLPARTLLEPFAGANNLIKMLRAINLCQQFSAFDMVPADKEVRRRDTLVEFPKNFGVCVTNPPWLARNSASRRKLPFPQTPHDDLYKHCLALCLRHCGHVAALVPESFIRSGLFINRLAAFISLNGEMFAETEHPAGLALFEPQAQSAPVIYCGGKKLGKMDTLKKHCPPLSQNRDKIIFNAAGGNLGLRALDNNRRASIRFCEAAELDGYEVKQSCRAITKIKVRGRPKIAEYNRFIDKFRNATKDVFLTAYRGLRKDGCYRRRLDYAMARDIINHVGF